MISPTTLTLLFAPLAAPGTPRTWIVDLFEAPDADFATIQEAVDAASDGDTILVRPGAIYDGFEIVDKDLVITAEEGSRVELEVDSVAAVRNLAAGKTVVLRGLGTVVVPPAQVRAPVLDARDCDGTLWLEDCVLSVFSSGDPFGIPPIQPAAKLTDCLSVVLLDSLVQGAPAVRSTRSGLHALGSTITSLAGPEAGIELDEAFALVSGGSVTGGPGVVNPAGPPCPSDGGPAVLAENGSELSTQAALLTGGTIDPALSFACLLLYGIGTPGTPGPPIVKDAASTVDALPGDVHATTTTPLAREGATLTRTFRGEPGELVYLFVSDDPEPVYQASVNGSVFTPSGTPFTLLGALDGTGTLVTTFPASFARALDGTSVAQALFVGGGGITFAGSPSTTTVLDTGLVLRTGIDCNRNGVSDAEDLALGTSLDCDHDGVPDECQPFTPTVTQVLQALDGKEDDGYGTALARDGDTLVVGAPYDRTVNSPFTERGAVYVYGRVGNGPWMQSQKLLNGVGQGSAHFGAALALEGDTLVVGLPDYTSFSSSLFFQGQAQVFERDGSGTWSLVQTLDVPAPFDRAHFGSQVALANGELVVAAPNGDDSSCSFQPRAYVYRRMGGLWTLAQTITTPTGSSCFGVAMALEDDLLAIGAPLASTVQGRGVVELYELVGGTWAPLQTLQPPDFVGSPGNFGRSLALLGGDLAVGARYKGTASPQDGAVFAFERMGGGAWLPAPVDELVLPPGQARSFGDRVTLDADLIVAAAPRTGLPPTLAVFPRRDDGRWPRLSPTRVELDDDVTALALVDDLVVVGLAEGDGSEAGSGVVLVYRLEDLTVPNPCRLSGPGPARVAPAPQAR